MMRRVRRCSRLIVRVIICRFLGRVKWGQGAGGNELLEKKVEEMREYDADQTVRTAF